MTNILQGDCREVLSEIENDSIDLVVTSPPYNVDVEYEDYDDNKTKREYELFISEVFSQLDNVVCEHGRVCINISLKNDFGIVDTASIIKEKAIDQGWEQRFEIIWDKGNSESSSAWGSWRSSSSPRPIFTHEYILIFDVSDSKRKSQKHIPKEEFMELVKSVWNVKPETSSDHPAAFPVEIPRRLIKLNSYPGDTVLDPFCGSGSTLIAAEELERDGIGIELSEEYIKMVEERMVMNGNVEKEEKGVFDY